MLQPLAAIELSRQPSSSKASVTKKAEMQGSRPRPVKAGQLASGQQAASPGALQLEPMDNVLTIVWSTRASEAEAYCYSGDTPLWWHHLHVARRLMSVSSNMLREITPGIEELIANILIRA